MNRRQLITASPLLLMTPGAMGASLPTPAQTPGPFYPDRRPLDDDGDLLQVTGQSRRAKGTVLHLHGRVVDTHGVPIAGCLVEIWQCDANGRYHHPRDTRGVAPDAGFQGYGRQMTIAGGGYRFRTIRPVPYPGRTPHIHFAVTGPGKPSLVTQMYIHGEPGNEQDFLYTRIPPELRERLTVALVRAPDPFQGLSGRFDIVLEA
jgi:protocatechuate 3,4-dioxygenase beta subunit